MELRTSVVIAMAHRLKDFEGPCRNLHGHNWTITAVFSIDPAQVNPVGYIVEFGKLRKAVRDAIDFFDHSTILEQGDPLIDALRNVAMSKTWVLNVPPSTENLASIFFEAVRGMIDAKFEGKLELNWLELVETPNNMVFSTGHSTGAKLV